MSEKSLRIHPDWIQEVRAAYKSRYFNQNKLAEEADISSVDTISKFLNGKPISRANFWRLCGLLELEREQVIRAIENSLNDLGKSANISNNTENSDFMGRDDNIAYIHHLTTQGNNCILILGELGIGKTALARNYFKQACSSYIEFSIAKERRNIVPVTRLIEEKLRQLNEEPSTEFLISLDRLKRKLQNEKIGILIDNLETALDDNGIFIEEHRNYVELLHILTDKSLRSTTLITSRQSLSEELDIYNLVLSGLDSTVWTIFFAQQDVHADRSILNKVHKSFGGNALAMKIVCMLIKTYHEGDLEGYWREHKIESDISVEQAVKNLARQQVAYPKVSSNHISTTPEIAPNTVSKEFDLLGRECDMSHHWAEYDENIWVGRTEQSEALCQNILGDCRVAVILGITGIGKTALAEKVAHQTKQKWDQIVRINFDDDKVSENFLEAAKSLLSQFGITPTAEDYQKTDGLLELLTYNIKSRQVLLIIDSLELILDENTQGEQTFRDVMWQRFFKTLFTTARCQGRIILTSQILPNAVEQIASRYTKYFFKSVMGGLNNVEQLELFAKAGLDIAENSESRTYLTRMGIVYEGHPLSLRTIIGEIQELCFGNVFAYWEQYREEYETVERDLVNIDGDSSSEDNWEIDRLSLSMENKVRFRLQQTFLRLKDSCYSAYCLLCEASIFRGTRLEKQWVSQFEARGDLSQELSASGIRDALNKLYAWYLVESELQQNKRYIRLHNLVRSVALKHLDDLP